MKGSVVPWLARPRLRYDTNFVHLPIQSPARLDNSLYVRWQRQCSDQDANGYDDAIHSVFDEWFCTRVAVHMAEFLARLCAEPAHRCGREDYILLRFNRGADGDRDPLNQQTSITSHTGGGLPLTIVDPNGVTTNLVYDPRQHLLSSTVMTSGGNRATTYGYDPAENLTSVTQPDGSRLTYTYDAAHRLTAITDLFGQKVSYTLDALGDRTANEHTERRERDYEPAFEYVRRTRKYASGHRRIEPNLDLYLRRHGQHGHGNRPGQQHDTSRVRRAEPSLPNHGPSQRITATSYDAHNRPLTVIAPTGTATAYVYDGFGDVIQESNPNAGTTVYYYDSTGNRIKRVAATGAVTQLPTMPEQGFDDDFPV